ncbi:MAG: sigma-70 family RNA polymerase sigma factor [Planctomycetota bacterium]
MAVPPADPTDRNESALVAALKAGEDEAYETLVRTHAGRLLSVARRFLRNEDDARDALQDAFLQAFKGVSSFQEGARLGTWLHRIVVNASLMKLRKRARKSEPVLEDLLPEFLDDGHQADRAGSWGVAAQSSTESAADRAETLALVREKIDELPDSARTVLLLRDIEGLDTREVAQQLGIKEGAVKTRLHRARQALRTLLDPHFREGQA